MNNKFIALFTSAVVVVSFQNCSQVTPEMLSGDDQVGGLNVGDINIDEGPEIIVTDEDGEVVAQVPSPTTPPKSDEQMGGHQNPGQPPIVTGDHNKDEDKNCDKDKRQKDPWGKWQAQNMPDKVPPSEHQNSNDGKKEDAHNEEHRGDIQSALKLCRDQSQASSGLIQDAKKIVNLRGSLSASGDQIDLIKDIRGNLIVHGKAASSKVALVDDVRGKVILCGLDVSKAVNTRGKLVIVDGSLGEVVNHKGTILLVNSEIGSVD